MSVAKISGLCWTFFAVMCVGFVPLAIGIMGIRAIPAGPRVALMLIVVLAVWWGPFGYAMYLSLAVIRNGDRRTLRRGSRGTAEVLAATATSTVIAEGESAWQAPRLYKYRLRVFLPGRAPYETSCSICASGINPGAIVEVAVGRRNRKRVTIDVGQGDTRGRAQPAGPGRADRELTGLRYG